MSALERGRAAHEQRAWRQAVEQLAAADVEDPLEPDDLELLATAAQLSGDDETSDATRQRLYHLCLEEGDTARATRSAFMLGMALMNRGEPAQGGAWLGRAGELAATLDPGCAERGYVLVPRGLQALGGGNPQEALELFDRVRQIGAGCGETDLVAVGRLGTGQSLLALGRLDDGLASLDAAMVAVVADELTPWISGVVYCGVVEACHTIGDLARSREWTRALSAWCDSQPDLVPFRGRCLVHRSEILQLDGSWDLALDEAQRACALLAEPPGQPPLGAAWYQLGELQRLRGETEAAEDSYRRASDHGHEPQPGLAVLRAATGNADAAETSLARLLSEGRLRDRLPRLLSSHVEVALAARRPEAAKRSFDELTELASGSSAGPIAALAAVAGAQLAIERSDAQAALVRLRGAVELWTDLGGVYEVARARELIARACALLGDLDTADLELAAARSTYERLGAAGDVKRVDADAPDVPDPASGSGLTGRELEVLRHVANGETNREIAEQLYISDKTVARHVANIFIKLEVSSRTAATAYAYEHDLV